MGSAERFWLVGRKEGGRMWRLEKWTRSVLPSIGPGHGRRRRKILIGRTEGRAAQRRSRERKKERKREKLAAVLAAAVKENSGAKNPSGCYRRHRRRRRCRRRPHLVLPYRCGTRCGQSGINDIGDWFFRPLTYYIFWMTVVKTSNIYFVM